MSGRYASVVVEADGGSRGNPGPAAYGAVLRDAETGAVIAERGERIGVATNNVAEYRGLIAGLELYLAHAEGADLEVRLDSKLVVEQMSGRWKIKHPDMRPLAVEANRLAPFGTRFTWVPRERNKHADKLANLALDGPEGVVVHTAGPAPARTAAGPADSARELPPPPWELGPPTTLVLVRHGETDHTRARLFSGRDGADPSLNDSGREQVRAAARWLAPVAGRDPVLLTSPMRRTRETAEVLADVLGVTAAVEPGLVEAGFGSWEGLTYAEVLERDREGFTGYAYDHDVAAGGTGDSMNAAAARVHGLLDRLLPGHRGRVVVASTHLTPIRLLVARALEVPTSALFRIEAAPASVTVLSWLDDGRPVVRMLNGRPGASLDL